MKDTMKRCLVEFIGTFFLILTVGCTVFSNSTGIIPAVAIGLILMVMVYAGGHVSGGHYNPAVSFSAAVRGALCWNQLVPYWLAQFAGGALAALLVRNLVIVEAAQTPFDLMPLILCEFLFTFALCYVVLHTATSRDTEGNSYFGLAIGATVIAGIFATARISYGAFNPAVVLGLATMGAATWKIFGIITGTTLLAGLLAAMVYKMTNKDY